MNLNTDSGYKMKGLDYTKLVDSYKQLSIDRRKHRRAFKMSGEESGEECSPEKKRLLEVCKQADDEVQQHQRQLLVQQELLLRSEKKLDNAKRELNDQEQTERGEKDLASLRTLLDLAQQENGLFANYLTNGQELECLFRDLVKYSNAISDASLQKFQLMSGQGKREEVQQEMQRVIRLKASFDKMARQARVGIKCLLKLQYMVPKFKALDLSAHFNQLNLVDADLPHCSLQDFDSSLPQLPQLPELLYDSEESSVQSEETVKHVDDESGLSGGNRQTDEC